MDIKEKNIDTMIDVLMDVGNINMLSSLIAKLESLTFDEDRTSIFNTPWCKRLFSMCAARMLNKTPENASFDIDDWFRAHVTHGHKIHRDIDPSLYIQPVDTDWLSALFELEMKCTTTTTKQSIVKVLCNMMNLEDAILEKLSKYCKTTRQYKFEGFSKAYENHGNVNKLLMQADPPRPKPGSTEDLLNAAMEKNNVTFKQNKK